MKNSKKLIVSILIILLLPLVIENLIGGYFIHNDANKVIKNNVDLKENSSKVITINKDIYKLRFEADTKEKIIVKVDLNNDKKFDKQMAFDRSHLQSTISTNDKNIKNITVKANKNIKINKILKIGHDTFNWSRYLFILIITILAVLLIIYRNYWFKNINKLFLLLSLSLGSMYIFCGPVGSDTTPDEGIHFENTYKLFKHGVYGLDDSYRSLRYESGIHLNDYSDKEALISEIIKEQNKNEIGDYKSIYFPYSKVDYLPGAIGMKLTSIVFNNDMISYYAGKLFNLAFYVLVGYFVIKNAKVGKNLIAAILLLPSCIVLGSGYSLDGMIIPSLLGAISLMLNVLSKKEKVTLKWGVAFVILMSIACLGKPVFVPVFLIPILLFKQDDLKDIKRSKFNVGLLLVMLVMASSLVIPLLQNAGGPGDLRGGIVSPVQQVKYIFANLGAFVLYFTSACLNVFKNVVLSVECYADYFYYGHNVIAGAIAIVPLLYYVFSDEEIKYTMNKKQRIVFMILYILMFCMICGSMYLAFTEVGKHFIVGVQARYLFPILLILLFVIGGWMPKKFVIKLEYRKRLLFIGIILGNILMFITQYVIICL